MTHRYFHDCKYCGKAFTALLKYGRTCAECKKVHYSGHRKKSDKLKELK